MKAKRTVVVLACCFLVFEISSGIVAWHAKAKARQLLLTIDRFRLGTTSKSDAESNLRQLGLVPQEEACSAVQGTCEGFAVVVSNHHELSYNDVIRLPEYLLAEASLFRPTDLVANFYFHSGQLNDFSVNYGTDGVQIRIELNAAEIAGEGALSYWRRDNHTDERTFVVSPDYVHEQEVSLHLADIFDPSCMASLRGCNTETKLWPSVASYKTTESLVPSSF